MQLVTVGPIRHLVIAVFAGAMVVPSCTSAQSFAPYADFQSMSQADLATLQVKLTFAGNQTSGTRSLLFTAQGNAPTIALFTPYRRSGISYVNDDDAPLTFFATTQELKAMIDSVAAVADVTDGNVDPDGYVSFAMLNTAGGIKVFEAVVNETTGPLLMGQVLSALKGNSAGVRLLTQAGCDAEILPADTPGSLEGQASIILSGLRRDRSATGKVFVGNVRVTNTSASPIAGPLSLVIVRKGNAELIGETGITCNIHPPGMPYVDVPITGELAPGASVVKTLRFNNPSLTKFNVDFRAFAGPGTR